MTPSSKHNLHYDLTENVWEPESVVPENVKALLNPADANFKVNYVLAFIQIVALLKVNKRTGWLDRGIPSKNCESISDHMYRMSIISLILPNAELDISKCVKISIIHDIAESLVGDITPFGGVSKEEKHRREYLTIKYLSSLVKPYNPVAAEEILELWLDYEEIRCIEAQYVKDIDKFEMIQQAWDYEQQFGLKYDLEEFYDSRKMIKSNEVGQLCDGIIEKRKLFLQQQQQQKGQEQ